MITDDVMQGAYLATAPQPVSNADFMRELRRALGMPIGLPAKNWMVRLGAPLLMRTDPELALYGRYCVSRRLQEENFEFSSFRTCAARCGTYAAPRIPVNPLLPPLNQSELLIVLA